MKTITLLTIALLLVGAVAVPALADPDHADERKEAAKEKAAERAGDRVNRSDEPGERRAEHLAKHDERRNATIAKAQERCAAYENRTGRDLPACDRLDEVHGDALQARRAAHALIKAIDALEHRIVVLEKLEVKFMDKLEGDNLTANQTAAYEAKLVRIQDAQNKALEKIEKMEERLENLKAKWDAVRDHADDQARVLVCHDGEDGERTLRITRHAYPAHERHGDSLGACADDAVDDGSMDAADAAGASDGADDEASSDAGDGAADDASSDAGADDDASDGA